ncbi:MAG: DUF5686 family protein [Bacteroidales bacterium]|nr:DUF5686 family protein [Bacteroidales bacterium]
MAEGGEALAQYFQNETPDVNADAPKIPVASPRKRTVRRDSITADSVMALVYSYTSRYNLKTQDFKSEVYVRHTLQTRRRNILTRYIPGMLRLERGTNEYFGESLSLYQYRVPGEVDKKDIAAYSTMPYLRPSNDIWIGRYSIAIYEPTIFTDRILSPLNYRNRKFYRYSTRYTYINEGHLVVSIAVKPRISNMQLVRGSIDVDLSSGRVERFDLTFLYGWARLHVSAEMGREGQASLLPNRILLASQLKFLGNRIDETFEASATYDLSPLPRPADTVSIVHRFDLSQQSLLRTDTTSMRRDRAFFDANRPFPLMDSQAAIYRAREVRDSIRNADAALRAAAEAADSAAQKKRRRFFTARTEDLLLDSHTLGLTGQSRIKLPPIFTPSMVQWSQSGGFSLQTRLVFRYENERQNYIDFAPRVGYNFKQEQVYWRLPLTICVFPQYSGHIRIEAAGGDHMYNSQQADEVRQRLELVNDYDSLISVFDHYDFHYYRDNHLLTTITFQPIVGLELSTGFRYHHRTLLNWNSMASQTGMRRVLSSFAPRVHVTWTPALYYYRNGRVPVALHTKWPTFMVDYERGLKSFNNTTFYERIELDAKYTLSLYALRSLYLRAGCGFFTQRGDNCFFDYDYFRNSYLPIGWQDEISGQFQLLDSRWYNESRHYVRLSAAYESPMLLVSRLRWLTRVIQKERIYVNLLNVSTLGYYSEWGYGIATPLLDVAGFIAVAGHKQTGVGVKLVLRLGED